MPRSHDLPFSDSDWTSDVPAVPERRDQRVAAALIAGVAIGALGATLLWWLATTVSHAPRLADTPAIAAAPPAAPASASATTAAVPAAAASEPSDRAVPEPPAPEVAAASVAAPPAAAVAQQTAALADEAARRKERAWRKFYQPPAICSEDRRGDFLVECANHSIRARKEFEERYATGRL